MYLRATGMAYLIPNLSLLKVCAHISNYNSYLSPHSLNLIPNLSLLNLTVTVALKYVHILIKRLVKRP